MEIGFSLYLHTSLKRNIEIIDSYSKYGLTYVFSSLNISEENINKTEALGEIINICRHKNLKLIVDVTKKSISQLQKISPYPDLLLRIDDGFSLDEIVSLSQTRKIVLNASTLLEADIAYMKKVGLNVENCMCMHNYYPKKYTGIGLNQLREKNITLRSYGIKNMAFVPGDELRYPIFEGLPTVESHRNKRFLSSILELFSNYTDIIFIGDIFINESHMKEIEYIKNGILPLRNDKNILCDILFKDRKDYSDLVIRNSVKNRELFLAHIKDILKSSSYQSEGGTQIHKGDILISNEKYQRYEGELEIAKQNLDFDEKRNIIARVVEEDIELLDFVHKFQNFIFVKYDNFNQSMMGNVFGKNST